MKLNTVIKLPDGREGTMCWNHLDGAGGVWGRHHFAMPLDGFSNSLPRPDFMLREPKVKEILIDMGHKPDLECVGHDYEIIQGGE